MHESDPSRGGSAAESVATTSLWTVVPSIDVAVHARVWGEPAGGPTVVLVHGLGLSSRYLTPLGRRLGALGYRVLAPDLPGFGKTRTPAGASWASAPAVHEQAGQLIAWMDAVGLERPVLFGNSLGTQVVVEAAVRHPHRVDRLVLEAPMPDPQYRTAVRLFRRMLRNMLFEPPSMNAVYQVEWASAAVVRMLQHLRRTVDDPIELRLPRVEAPALVVRGRYDQSSSQQWAERFSGLLPDARLVLVEGAPHNVSFAAPQIVSRLVHAFLGDRLIPHDGDVVLSGPDGSDPLAPWRPMPLGTHRALEVLGAALALALSRALGTAPRTRMVLMASASVTTLNGMLTEGPFGFSRQVPMPVHLNLDAMSGVQLLWAAARLLRKEPRLGRWLVAGLGAYQLLSANLTREPVGPARLVPSDRPTGAGGQQQGGSPQC